MTWTLGVKKLILPPAGPLIVIATGLILVAFGRERSGLSVAAAGLAALYLASAPWLGRWLLRSLDRGDVLDPDGPEARAAGAIVILDAGLEPVPAPMGFADGLRSESGLMALVPSARVLLASYLALHEWVGIAWYRIRYRHGRSCSAASRRHHVA
jgi:uncharacterized SAM-binding protein YcdF (DUF218 family)